MSTKSILKGRKVDHKEAYIFGHRAERVNWMNFTARLEDSEAADFPPKVGASVFSICIQ